MLERVIIEEVWSGWSKRNGREVGGFRDRWEWMTEIEVIFLLALS